MEKTSWMITFGSGTPLANYYIQLDNMTNEEARWWAHKTFFGRMWCGCYPLSELESVIRSYPNGCHKLDMPKHLNFPVEG